MTFSKIIFATAILFSIQSFALSLDEARKAGKVKELPTGYIEAAGKGADVKALVNEVNSKRKKHYESVAKKNGTDPNVVGKAAAEKIKAKLSN